MELQKISIDMLIPKGFVPSGFTLVLVEKAVELCNEVQSVVNRQCRPLSGLRTLDDYLRLKRNGYNPSVKSDHFFGLPINVNGVIYNESIGAVDLYIPGLRTVFVHIVNYFLNTYKHNIDRPRQIIFETGANFGDWLHIANVPSRIFSKDVAKIKLHKNPLLYTFDNGKTYNIFDINNPPDELLDTVPLTINTKTESKKRNKQK